jgi:hypothetical protein
MSLLERLRRSDRPNDREMAFREREAEARAIREAGTSEVSHPAPARRSPTGATAPAASAQRLDELRAQARFARERYDLYKARTYGPRLTSPSRLQQLERESERAQTSLTFAMAEAARQAGGDVAAGGSGETH